jgi:DNA invertase Pin-like site-specific DNA recombinase
MATRIAIYARVSTGGQTTENQIRELEAVAARMDGRIVQRFIDDGISGSKGRRNRPAFDQLHKAITRREVDMVMAWSVDRLGRSLQDLVSLLEELRSLNVDLYLHQQGIDTTTPAGKAMFQMCAVFAEFERSMIQERVKAGLARARAAGKKLGRPLTKPDIEAKIRHALKSGDKGIRKIAREFGVGTSVVQRLKADLLTE